MAGYGDIARYREIWEIQWDTREISTDIAKVYVRPALRLPAHDFGFYRYLRV